MITLIEGFRGLHVPHRRAPLRVLISKDALFHQLYVFVLKMGYTMVYPFKKNVFVQVFHQLYQGIPPFMAVFMAVFIGKCFSASSVRSLAIDLAHAGRDGKTPSVFMVYQ